MGAAGLASWKEEVSSTANDVWFRHTIAEELAQVQTVEHVTFSDRLDGSARLMALARAHLPR